MHFCATLDIVREWRAIVLVRPVSVKGGCALAVAGVGDAGVTCPDTLVHGVRMRGRVRCSSISRALGGVRAVTLSLIRWFCSSASPSSGKRGVVLQQRVSRETGGEWGELSVNIGSQQRRRCPPTKTSLNTINILIWTKIAHKYSHSAPGPCQPSCCPRRRGRRRSWRSWTCS